MAQRILTLILLLCSTPALAGLFDAPGRSSFVPADQAFMFDFQQQQNELRLNWQVKEGYYLYRQQIKLTAQQAEIARHNCLSASRITMSFMAKARFIANSCTCR
jgi:thiol:disulfide interchange protein DsbD